MKSKIHELSLKPNKKAMCKTRLTLIIAILITISSLAQQGINYKALIKDTNGEVLATTTVNIEFTIKKGASLTDVYEEGHTTPTDNNGILIVNIGEGNATLGSFDSIDWGSDDHFLNVKINTGSGFIDMGTTQFMAVPYALSAVNIGLEPLDEGNGIGWRLQGQNPDFYGNIGIGAVDLSNNISGTSTIKGATGGGATAVGNATEASGVYSTAMGDDSVASGSVSIAMGNSSVASGSVSVSMGNGTTASGSFSTAMGTFTKATGNTSTATGNNTTASGSYSTAMGTNTKANAYATTAIGIFNNGGGHLNLQLSTNPLFEIGNGTDEVNRSNALTVFGGSNTFLSNPTSGYVMIGNSDATNLVFDTNEIMARNNGSTANLTLQREGGNVIVGGVTVHVSDRRLKKDIQSLPYGLNEVLKLNPKTYNWKNREQEHKSLGLIAQEVQVIIKEIVTTQDDKNKTLGISYIELIPILINAIKEQQIMIDNQASKLENKNSVLKDLITKVNKIEKLVYQKNDVVANNSRQ